MRRWRSGWRQWPAPSLMRKHRACRSQAAVTFFSGRPYGPSPLHVAGAVCVLHSYEEPNHQNAPGRFKQPGASHRSGHGDGEVDELDGDRIRTSGFAVAISVAFTMAALWTWETPLNELGPRVQRARPIMADGHSCIACNLGIELRHSVSDPMSSSQGFWSHLDDVEGIAADLDHQALK